jgi:poly-gamma-glutamate synthesis protein (capsule biosynthesis protein)
MWFNKKNLIVLVLIFPAAILMAVGLFYFLKETKNNDQITGNQTRKTAEPVNMQENVNILFVGDLMFDRGIRYYAEKNGGNNFIFKKINNELLKYDFVVANLEGPITEEKSISANTSPGSTNNYFFTFDPSVAKTLYENNIKIVNLGNNHILNFGENGLISTKKYLKNENIEYFGDPFENKSIIKDFNGFKIAFINYNEFLEKDVQFTINQIKNIKPVVDVVILYAHWGVEYVKNPSEYQKQLACQFIDEGADIIIGSHPHVIQTKEKYKERIIYYSLGNFIFDQHFSEDVKRGLGVAMEISKQKKEIKFKEINFYLDPNGQTTIID